MKHKGKKKKSKFRIISNLKNKERINENFKFEQLLFLEALFNNWLSDIVTKTNYRYENIAQWVVQRTKYEFFKRKKAK